jgi:hypothetical protein
MVCHSWLAIGNFAVRNSQMAVCAESGSRYDAKRPLEKVKYFMEGFGITLGDRQFWWLVKLVSPH